MPFATVNQHTIQYVESGQLGFQVQEDKLPIVCVHGLGSSQNYYMPVVPYLEGHRVVALSTYGAAGSKSQGEKLSLVDMAEDVVGLMDHLNIPKAIVVGHSMGGPMVLTAAARHPDRFAGVVAIGPVNPSSVKPEVFQTRIETVLKGDNSQFFKPASRRYVLTFFWSQTAWSHWRIRCPKLPRAPIAHLSSEHLSESSSSAKIPNRMRLIARRLSI